MSPTRTRTTQTHRGGFTLIEVLAGVFLTTIVITAAVGFYVNLSSAARRATDMMREDLHGSAVLDRIGRDLESASLLVKKPEEDPLAHPWYFVADSQQSFSGSDRVKFISRSQKPRASLSHGSDLAQVVYFTEPQEDGTLTLFRWLSPGLPIRYPVDYPDSDDAGAFVLAEGVSTFEMRFLGESGEWVDEWDSTQLVDSTQLPVAAELSVSFAPPVDVDERFLEDEEPPVHSRTVMLSSRPLDLNQLIEEKVAAMASIEESRLGTARNEGADAEGGTTSCMDICLANKSQAFCTEAFASAEGTPVAAAFRAEFNCQ